MMTGNVVQIIQAFGILLCLTPQPTRAQQITATSLTLTDSLICRSMENVSCSENTLEINYILETSAWRQPSAGITKAVEYIQNYGIPEGKDCRIIVLDNNIPQFSLYYLHNSRRVPPNFKSIRQQWDVSYNIGDEWNLLRKLPRSNSSLFKADLVIYPELALKNLVITQIYQVLFNLSPALEISFWPGMKFVGQIVFPIYCDGYSESDKKIHPRVIALSQSFRLPRRTFARVCAGMFYSDRYGADLTLRHYLHNERFSIEGRLGYTGPGRWEGFTIHYGKEFRLTWSIGGTYFCPRYNTQFSIKAEQYLLQEKGVRCDLIRHFNHCSIGFYAMKAQGALKNGGFRFQIALPPYRNKRSRWGRIVPSSQMGMVYNAGNELYYYKNYRALPEDNIMKDNGFNPFFILNN